MISVFPPPPPPPYPLPLPLPRHRQLLRHFERPDDPQRLEGATFRSLGAALCNSRISPLGGRERRARVLVLVQCDLWFITGGVFFRDFLAFMIIFFFFFETLKVHDLIIYNRNIYYEPCCTLFYRLQYFEWPLRNNSHAAIGSVWYPLFVIDPRWRRQSQRLKCSLRSPSHLPP